MSIQDCKGRGQTDLRQCPALEGVCLSDVHGAIKALLACRGFTWDVLTKGDWTGCHHRLLWLLKEQHGSETLLDAFKEDGA